ncbi:DUF2550 domain-containing protein [Corynebacterium callunae]|uniref:DUF2550 domain-containing protein n=1 Tax=Corynebacterium callunae TaxID=1721 RepID=UPI001FFFA706|nr:DUF2550 domain-containing protein [Corynebacterium callunae]
MEFITLALVIVAVLAVVLAAWRFFTLRSRGTTVILRHLPQNGLHGWRHGTLRYNANDLEYFKLRSLSPMADLILNRLSVTLLDRREPTAEEAVFMFEGSRVIHIKSKNEELELALDSYGEMAFTAWLEAAPDARSEHSISAHELQRFRFGEFGKGTQKDK